MTQSRFYPACLREKQPVRRSLLSCTIRTRNPKITVRLRPITVRDMRTILSTRNTVSAITAVADVPPGATIGRVAAGAIAVKILNQLGITFLTYTRSIGPISISSQNFDAAQINENPLYMPDADAAENAENYLNACIAEQNSSGGVVECIIQGVPAGLGDPVFEKLNANLAKAVMSIGAVKGFEIGDGFDVAKATGKNDNDAFRIGADGRPVKTTNHAGGILGGMSDGSDIILRAAIKPTPSIAAPQQTVNKDGEEIDVSIKGRHDPIIVPRAVVVVESMAAVTLVDALFTNMSARMDSLEMFYQH